MRLPTRTPARPSSRASLSRLLAGLGLATALALPLAAAGPASAAGPDPVDVTPDALDRGADPGVPVVKGRRIVDGDLSVRVGGRHLTLLGEDGDEYIASVKRRSRWRTLAVDAEGRTRMLTLNHSPDEQRLSEDGTRLALLRRYHEGHYLAVLETGTRTQSVSTMIRGDARLLDVGRRKVVVSNWTRGRTMVVDQRTNRARLVVRQRGYAASIADDRLAVLTGAPYPDSCSRLTTLSDPGTALWSSCRQAVTSIAPGGELVSTAALPLDGPIGRVEVHRTNGALVAAYETPDGWLDAARWESPTSLLMMAHDADHEALVRCEGPDCERAGDLRRPAWAD